MTDGGTIEIKSKLEEWRRLRESALEEALVRADFLRKELADVEGDIRVLRGDRAVSARKSVRLARPRGAAIRMILDAIGKTPEASVRQIATATGLAYAQVSVALTRMVWSGRVSCSGQGRERRYSLGTGASA